jgi:hypothetical protein
MSARNPTTYNQFADEAQIEQREQITTTTPSAVADDQVFVLDQQELIVSHCGLSVEAPTGTHLLGDFKLDSKDMCDVAGVSNNEIAHSVQAYGRVSAGGTTGTVTITSTLATGSTSCTVTFSSTTAAWVAASGTMNIKSNANEDTISTVVARTAGAGYVCVYGIAIVADET